MISGLNNGQVKWLTYLVYILLSALTLVTGFHAYVISQLPEEYVRLERYICDEDRTERQLIRIDSKLDRLIERGITKLGPGSG